MIIRNRESIMATSEFMVLLPSNASTKVFPSNSVSSYKIKLQQPLPCNDGKWLVGLSEITYPSRWKNVVNDFVRVKIAQEQDFNHVFDFPLTDGTYDMQSLLAEIREIFHQVSATEIATLEYNEQNRKVTLDLKDDLELTFSQNILNILGLRKREGEYYTRGVYAAAENSTADITGGFYAIYIYTNIVHTTLVGDTVAPILRVVPLKESKGNFCQISQSFQNIQFHPVVATQTDVIEINIRKDTGSFVPFDGGKAIITLQFKKQ